MRGPESNTLQSETQVRRPRAERGRPDCGVPRRGPRRHRRLRAQPAEGEKRVWRETGEMTMETEFELQMKHSFRVAVAPA